MSLIENMFMGKLIMVSNTMGWLSVIKDGVNGYVCETVEDYARHIREAMKEWPQSLCDKAVSDVRTVYNTEAMSRKYLQFYREVIEGKFD